MSGGVPGVAERASWLEDVPPTPLAESLRRLRSLVSEHVGIVRTVHTNLATADDAPLASISAQLADARDLVGADVDARAVAWSPDRETSLAAALGEAAERYSASLVPDEGVVLSSADELGAEAAEPERFALFREDQYAAPDFAPVPFLGSTRVRWVRGAALPSGAPAWLPVQLVYLTALPPAPGEALIGYTTSSGLACAPTFGEALERALLELVERDAFVLTWTNRLSLPRLEIGGCAGAEAFLGRYVEPTGLAVSAVDLSVFHGVPTVLALVRSARADDVALAVGAAAVRCAPTAWRRAVAEAFAGRAWARLVRREQPERTYEPPFLDVVDFEDHVHLYAQPQHAVYADFLDSSSRTRPLSAVPDLEGQGVRDRVAALLARLERSGARAYVVDVTAPDVRDAGLVVVKVVAPELCALDVSHHGRFLGGRRLYEAAATLGLRPTPLAWSEVNPHPHPFP